MSMWKTPAIAGGFAFIAATLIGLINSVGIVSVLGRSLVSGITFGALAMLAEWVLRSFLPELFIDVSESPGGDESGEQVNIVLPDENPHLESEGGLEKVEPSEDLDEEVAEVILAKEWDDGPSPAKDLERTGDVSDILDSVDELPDMGSFAGDFEETSFTEEEGFAPSVENISHGDVDSINGDKENSPQQMAKAIQTILKKDQDG